MGLRDINTTFRTKEDGGNLRWKKVILLLLPLLPAVLFLAFFIRPGLGDLSGDSARYLLLGRALAEGRGFVELEKPEAPPHTE